jgi:hypothetical protein
LDRLEKAEIVVREEESFIYDSPARAPRVYYSLDPRSFPPCTASGAKYLMTFSPTARPIR